MTTLFQEIQEVRSLRKNIRNPKVSATLVSCIEVIHKSIASEQQTWKKMEWRQPLSHSSNSSHSAHSAHSSHSTHSAHSSHSAHSAHSAHNAQQKDTFFTNRMGYNRSKNIQKELQSIPLTPTAAVVNYVPPHHKQEKPEDTVPRYPKKVHTESSDGFRTIPQKYVSKFKKTAENVDDTILNTILLGKLNKFSKSNYNEIKEFITHIIDSGQTVMIKCFMKLVFEKAASEEIFCPLYAKLLSELSACYPVLLTEMEQLYAEYMKIFEEVSDGANEDYNELCARNIAKKYRRGYSQFLTELIKYNVIDADTFMKTIMKIVQQVEFAVKEPESVKRNEEFADCLIKILKAIQVTRRNTEDDEIGGLDTIRRVLKEQVIDHIKPLSMRQPENLGISNKARFTFLDLYEGLLKL
jgi:hypothetical protein